MKIFNIEWQRLYSFLKENNINSFKRMALCYPVSEFSTGNKKNPFTIFDSQRNYGKNLGYQKEGIQLNINGNPNKLNFDIDKIFI